MQMINGKLLGNPESNFDELKQQFNDLHQDISGIKINIQQLHKYYQQLEATVNIQQKKQIQTYQQQLKAIQLPVNKIDGRLTILETTTFNRIENTFKNFKEQITTKIFWLGFYSFLIFGSISLCNWIELNSLKNKIQSQNMSLDLEMLEGLNLNVSSNSKIS